MRMNFQDSLKEDLIKDHQFAMNTVGFNVVHDFFTDDICAILRERLERAIESYASVSVSERSALDRFHMHDLLARDEVFAETLEDSRLQQLIAPILGEFWIMYAYTSSSLPPNGGNYGSRIHVDSPRFIPNYPTNLGVIWALDDFTEENGATYILPGSHSTNLSPSKEYFDKNSVRLTCKKGSVILFNARVWHAAGTNHTNTFRHALTMNVCRPYMKQRMDFVRLIPDEITKNLNDQARRIIGFNTRLPTTMEEFFKPEDERLYKANQE